MSHNPVVFISGASRGIGLEIAKQAAQQGATCLLLARNMDALDKLYDEIVEQGGAAPVLLKLDLLSAEPQAYQALAERISHTVDHIDVLFHLAAHKPKLTPIEHYDIRHWFEVMQVNCHAPFLLTQALLPLLKQAPKAEIIFAHHDSKQAKAYWGAHSCAFAATENLQKILNHELENTNIHAQCFDPGATNTLFRRHAFPAEINQNLQTPAQAAEKFLAQVRLS